MHLNRNLFSAVFSLIFFIASIIFTCLSGGGSFLPITLIAIGILGIAISYLFASWSKGNMIENFKKSLKFSFGISSFIYLTGYFFVSIYSIL